MNTDKAHEAVKTMPKYDLSGMLAVKLLINDETSKKIADLRSHFRTTRKEQDSLAYVCQEAIALMHSQIFSQVPRPNDADYFLRTDAK